MKTPFVTEILKKIAPKVGADLLIEPEYGFVGQVTFKSGKKMLFRGSNFNVNRLGSVEIARDKGYASFFLRSFGYKTPEGQTFFSEKLCQNLIIKRTIDDGFTYAQQLGFPVILKPNNRSQGMLVTKVYTKRDYYRVARQIFKKSGVLLVQKYYAGRDYRVVVLDDEVISAYERIPLVISGNGQSSIRDLLKHKQDLFLESGRDTVIGVDDFRIKLKLRRQKLSLDSILPNGKSVYLLDNANLSTGGDALDVTDNLHPSFRELAIRITKDMGLRLCGVDILADDITLPLKDYIIIEINGAPGLDNYASMGQAQAKVVESLYLKVLRALENDNSDR
jgi:D-alanine-D-alanine ligase-like ATP-grasp enzyme